MRDEVVLQLPTTPRRTLARSVAWRQGDRVLLLAALGLTAFGLIMVFSASEVQGWMFYHNSAYFFERQGMWCVLGAALLWAAARFDYHRLKALAGPLAVVTLLALVLVLVPHVGVQLNGARRWIRLGPLQMQPAELAKISGILYVAAWLDRHRDRIGSLERGVAPFLALLALLSGLIILERDLGTTMILGAILLSQFLVAGGRRRHLLLIFVVVALSMVVFIRVEPYRVQRIMTFLNPWSDPLNTGFQPIQSLLALGSGGIFGVGLGQSIQKYLWLPFAHTDFIFAIIGEETGLIGTTAVLSGFALFTYRGFRIALKAPDVFGSLVACGITVWISFQTVINMAAVTVTLPTTGVPLPFISYGGSSLALSLMAVGILMNIASQGQKVGWIRHASIDLGRRYGRTPVSSDRSGAGVAAQRS